jgi:hypothetical protein
VSGPLACRSCGAGHPLDERFCRDCGSPLVFTAGGFAEVTERQERARKIRPEYAQGEPVIVAAARNQAEAELLQGMLLEEGVPSMTRRTGGFDVPDFLASGPRHILVPLSGADAARDVLQIAVSAAAPPAPAATWVKVLAIVLVVLVLGSVAGALIGSVLR